MTKRCLTWFGYDQTSLVKDAESKMSKDKLLSNLKQSIVHILMDAVAASLLVTDRDWETS